MIDLAPAAQRMASLLDGVHDLDAPTPCPDYSVGDLLDHVDGLALAFTAAARKELGEVTAGAPVPGAANLGDNWRQRIPARLGALVEAWGEPASWTGTTQAGGVDLSGEEAGVVALDELVLHGWDLAMATGQAYEPDEASVQACHGFVAQVADAGGAAIFGPAVEIPADAPLFDRVLGLSGRRPDWSSA